MIAINLLPHHLRPVKRTPLPYILSVALLALVILASASVWVKTQAEVANASSTLAGHRKDLDALKEVVDEYNGLVAKKKELKVKTETIQQIVKDRIIWSRELWNLARLAPPNLWYDDISVETESKQQSREVREQAVNPKTHKKVMKLVTKQETVTVPVLKVSGTVIPGADGSNDINPYLLATERDPEFSSLFKIDDQEVKNVVVDGRQTKHFKLTFRILLGRSGK